MTSTDEFRRPLLISNSTLDGSGYLDHAEKEIRDCVGDRTGSSSFHWLFTIGKRTQPRRMHDFATWACTHVRS
jgi:hypothetical protein